MKITDVVAAVTALLLSILLGLLYERWVKAGAVKRTATRIIVISLALLLAISINAFLAGYQIFVPTSATTETLTLTPSLTSTSSPTDTSTPTSTLKATLTPTRKPVVQPPLYPEPELLGIDIIGCKATFHWKWGEQLAEEAYFGLRVGIGDPGYSRVWTKEDQYTCTLAEAGEYVWEVAICRGDPKARVCEQLAVSERKTFHFGGCQPAPTPIMPCSFVAPYRSPIEGPSVDVEASITSIENCTDNLPTSTSISLGGTYSGDLTDKELWVLVYPPGLSYYPQSRDACRSLSTMFRDGRWVETIYLGRPGAPEAFHIVLVVAEIGSPASDAFHEYLDRGCRSNDYWGLNLIPEGATELDSIVVRTK